MVVYFSGTGNSRFCAERLAEELHDELRDAFGFIKNGIAAEFISGKPWVFVAPIYAWRMARVFADFIRSGNFDGSEDAYFVLTCGSDIGNAGKAAEELCREKGLRFRGVFGVSMPENYIAMFKAPGAEKCARMVSEARGRLTECAGYIKRGEDFPAAKVSAADKFKSGPVNEGFYKYFIKAKKFYTTDKCVGCGECAELCVLNNIVIRDGRPAWGEKCTHCMACICRCPHEAVEYGKGTRGKRRYYLDD